MEKKHIKTQTRLINITTLTEQKIIRFNLLTKKEKDTFINIIINSKKAESYLIRILNHICNIANIKNSDITTMILDINRYLMKKEIWLDIDWVKKDNGFLDKYFSLPKE